MILGGFLLVLAAVVLIWFAGYLRAVLRRAEGGVGHPSAIAYGGGVAAAAFMLVAPASNVFGALYAEQLGARGAQTFDLFGDVLLYPAAMAAAVLVGATALVALRTRVALLPGVAERDPRALAPDPAAGVVRGRSREPGRLDRAGRTVARTAWAAVTGVVAAIGGRAAPRTGELAHGLGSHVAETVAQEFAAPAAAPSTSATSREVGDQSGRQPARHRVAAALA